MMLVEEKSQMTWSATCCRIVYPDDDATAFKIFAVVDLVLVDTSGFIC